MFLGQVRDGLKDLVRSIHEGQNAMYTQRTAIAAAVEARQAHQRNTWAAFDEVCMFICVMRYQRVYKERGWRVIQYTLTPSRVYVHVHTRGQLESMLLVSEVQKESQPFVDTILCTPGQADGSEQTISSILMTPAPAGGIGAVRVAAAMGRDWGKVSSS
jgi:hypothetical protein